MKKDPPPSTRKEEIWNAITHGLGVPFSLLALVLLIRKGLDAEDSHYLWAVLIYGITMLWTYTSSTLYHANFQSSERLRHRLHLLDHTAIYLFIAGTYTPIALFVLPGLWSTGILGAIWALALIGVIYKLFFLEQHPKFSLFLYIAMGWLILIAFKPMMEEASRELLYWIIAGGAFYSLGTVFFSLRRLAFGHSIWHLLVLGGSICHFWGIYHYV